MDQDRRPNRLKEASLVMDGLIGYLQQRHQTKAQTEPQSPSDRDDREAIGLRRFEWEVRGIDDAELFPLLPLLEIRRQLRLQFLLQQRLIVLFGIVVIARDLGQLLFSQGSQVQPRLKVVHSRPQLHCFRLVAVDLRFRGFELSLKTPEHLEHALLLFGEFTNEADLVFAQALLLLSEILPRLFQLVFEEGGRTDGLLAPRLEILVNE